MKKEKDAVDKLKRAQAIILLEEYYKQNPRDKYPKYTEYTLHQLKLNIRMFDINLIEE
jgi:hypothetical protein